MFGVRGEWLRVVEAAQGAPSRGARPLLLRGVPGGQEGFRVAAGDVLAAESGQAQEGRGGGRGRAAGRIRGPPRVPFLPQKLLRRRRDVSPHAVGARDVPLVPQERTRDVRVLSRLRRARAALHHRAPPVSAPGVPGEEVRRLSEPAGAEEPRGPRARPRHDQGGAERGAARARRVQHERGQRGRGRRARSRTRGRAGEPAEGSEGAPERGGGG